MDELGSPYTLLREEEWVSAQTEVLVPRPWSLGASHWTSSAKPSPPRNNSFSHHLIDLAGIAGINGIWMAGLASLAAIARGYWRMAGLPSLAAFPRWWVGLLLGPTKTEWMNWQGGTLALEPIAGGGQTYPWRRCFDDWLKTITAIARYACPAGEESAPGMQPHCLKGHSNTVNGLGQDQGKLLSLLLVVLPR